MHTYAKSINAVEPQAMLRPPRVPAARVAWGSVKWMGSIEFSYGKYMGHSIIMGNLREIYEHRWNTYQEHLWEIWLGWAGKFLCKWGLSH